MFERFTVTARRVVVGAQAEAVALEHNYIGTEHILLGILRSGGGAGFQLLGLFGVAVDEVRERVEAIIGRGSESGPSGHMPFTPRAKKVLELSLREALLLKENFIGSEHVLLGLLREGDGIGARILRERGVTLAAVRDRLGDVEREGFTSDDFGGPGDETEEVEEPEGEGMIHVPAGDFTRLVAEVARLRDLLRHHGIDPDEPPPPDPGRFGDDGDPPVA